MSSESPSGDRLNTSENLAAAKWFEAIAARFRDRAAGWAGKLGLQGADAEQVAESAMEALALNLAEGAPPCPETNWQGVHAQLTVAVRNTVSNVWRQRKRKPADFGGSPKDGDADPLEDLADSENVDTWGSALAGNLSTGVGRVAESVKQKVGDRAWKAFFDLKLRELSAEQVREQRGYETTDEVYRDVAKVKAQFQRMLAERQ